MLTRKAVEDILSYGGTRDQVTRELAESLLSTFDKLDTERRAVEELCEALRLTVEYVDNLMLPPLEGWEWFDVLKKYRPKTAQKFVDHYNKVIVPKLRENHEWTQKMVDSFRAPDVK